MKIRRWALHRRLQYAAGTLTTLGLFAGLLYYGIWYTPAHCFDGVMNGKEQAVDCDGSCVRMCAFSVIPPKILWAESFQIVENQYNAVAYIENANQVASTPELSYTLQLYAGDEIVAERKGKTILPPNSVYPIFEGKIFTNGKKVTETKLMIDPPDVWLPASVGREQFKVANINLSGADARPRLDAMISNDELTLAEQVEIVATIFNADGQPVTASQTFVDKIEGRSTKNIVFTWPNSIAKTVKSCEVPTDVAIVIDLSGSMNNDGVNPPQPITDTLAAARTFVSELKGKDQVAIITFATDAAIVSPLGANHQTTATLIDALRINPKEEAGFTNTSAGIKAAAAELVSERHGSDARRVVVLLTDGLPTVTTGGQDPQAAAEAAARDVVQSGAEVYAIGLGKGVDLAFISKLTSDTEHSFYAPNTQDLNAIYKKISSSLCEVGTAKIEVIPKTSTNFAPLQ
jgi:Mg-chelatase subunit ChlD